MGFAVTGGVGFKNPFDLVADATEGIEFAFACTDGVGRIIEAPMIAVEQAGKGGAGLIGIAANGDHGGDAGIEVSVEVVGGVLRGVDANFGERFKGERVHLALGFGAGAEDFKEVAGGGTEDAFRHVTAAGVSGTEDEHFGFFHMYWVGCLEEICEGV